MKSIEVTILVEPTAKGRPRLTTVNGHARAYTPQKTVKAEAMIMADIRHEVMAHGRFEAGIPLRLEATFYRERPKHLPKRITMPMTRPDCDNYAKLLLDALNGYAFPDDSQLTSVKFKKRFCQPGQVPRIELRISEDEG